MYRVLIRRPALFLCVASVASVTLLASNAHARAGRVSQIPNNFSCATCHVGSTSPYNGNAFGDDVRATLVGGVSASSSVDWAAVCDLDSDGDGKTNGEELGDPCCVWTSGAPPLTSPKTRPGQSDTDLGSICDNGTAIPDPGTSAVDAGADLGDAGSPAAAEDAGNANPVQTEADAGAAPAPTEDAGNAPPAADAGPGDTGTGGCTCTTAPRAPNLGLFALAGFVLLAPRRRRR